MINFTYSITFAVLSAICLQISVIPLQIAQKDFRNRMWKQFKHSPLFTLLRMILNKMFLLFALLFALGLIFAYYMIVYNIDSNGTIYIIPFMIFILSLLIVLKLTEKYVKTYENENFGIQKRPRFEFKEKELFENYGETIEELEIIKDAFEKIYDLLDLNLINPMKKSKTHFATPGPKYPSAYLWDSAFISPIWRMWDYKIAEEIMLPFLVNQNENGMCPQTVPLGLTVNYNITNPPLIAWALLEIANMTGDISILKKVYPKLKKYNQFMEKERKNGDLYTWKHSYESGIDNSPRFTDASEKIKFNIQDMWAIDLNVWMVIQNDCIAKIADILGDKDDFKHYTNKKQDLISKINQYLWDEETGYYYDFDHVKNEFIKIPTIFSLFPLYSEIPNENQTQRLIEHIKNEEEFNTLIPFPTVVKNADEFMKDCWRGAVWINTSYVILKGLEKIGQENLKTDFAFRLVKGVAMTFENEGSIYEFYDPDNYTLEELTRKKGNLMKQITLGGKPVKKFAGWTGIVNTILIEDILGYKRIKNDVQFHPHIPESWKNIEIILNIPQFSEKITIELDKNQEVSVNYIQENDEGAEIKNTQYFGQNHEILKIKQ